MQFFIWIKNNKILFAILFLSIYLRLLGTNPGYYTTHPDEPTITDSVKKITLYLNFEPQAYYYGSLLALLYSIPTFLLLNPYLILSFVIKNYPTITEYGLFASKTIVNWNTFIITNHFFEYWVRYETAVLSGFTALMGYLLGKKLFNKEVGLVAAFYIAVNYRHTLSSNLALADAPAAFFVLLSVYLSSRLLKNLSWKTYFWAGVGLGLVFSVKYFVYTIPTFLLCHLIGSWKNRILTILINPKLVLSIFISLILFSLINAYIFIKPEDALFQIQYNTTKYSLFFSFEKFLDFTNVYFYPFYYLYKFAFGEILTLFLILGIIYSLIRYFKNALILLSAIVPFLYIFLIISDTTETRFYSAIIPLILFFPAVLTVDLAKGLKKLASKINLNVNLLLLIAFLTIVIGLQSFKLSLLSSYYFSTPYNSNAFQEWILKEMPDNINYAYFWGTPTPPGYKKINSTFITVDEDDYLSMEELDRNHTDYVAVGSDPGNIINGLLWINNNRIIKKVMLNDIYLWQYLSDSYASLITQELATYRIKEFTKPWPSLDPSFFVAKYPKFWNIGKGNKIIEYNFDNKSEINDWYSRTLDISPYYYLEYSPNLGYKNTGSILIKSTMDTLYQGPFAIFKSKFFKVEPSNWYILSAWAKRVRNTHDAGSKNGFIRLNFYNTDRVLLKSYVSAQLVPTGDIQILNAAGFAPSDADFGEIMIQLNNIDNENYMFDNLEIYSSNEKIILDKKEYPFFDQELSKSFIWLPHL